MQSKKYTFGQLRQSILESVSEFEPKYGEGYSTDKEKSENEKAHRDIAKEAEKLIGDAKTPEIEAKGKSQMAQVNLGMSDLQFDGPVSKEYKDRMKANLGGYSSALEKEVHANEVHGNATFDDAIAKEAERTAAEVKAMQDAYSEVGMTNAQKKKEDTHRHEDNLGESKKISLLKFKKVQFISESQMIAHIPDEYKKNGNKFYMQDCKGNKYLVEWNGKAEVSKMLNEEKANAEMNRIKYLFGYNGKESKTTNSIRMNENKEIDDMLGRVRSLMK